MVGYEEDSTNYHVPMRIAFERGAARQYDGAWINYASGNFGDACDYFTSGPHRAARRQELVPQQVRRHRRRVGVLVSQVVLPELSGRRVGDLLGAEPRRTSTSSPAPASIPSTCRRSAAAPRISWTSSVAFPIAASRTRRSPSC